MSTFYHVQYPSSIPQASGVYRIICTPTSKFYIGSAVNLWKRWKDHRHALNKGNHPNRKLQHAWNKYGKKAFTFEILEIVLIPELLTAREQHYFDTLKPFGKRGFNLVPVAGSNFGMRHSPESIARMSKSHRDRPSVRIGYKHTPETIEKLRISHRGKTPSQETRQKLSEANKNKQFSPEYREKIRSAKLGHDVSPETRAKISASNTGHTYALEVYAGRMKTLIITAPDGTEYVVTGIKQFCREHNLDCSSLMRVAKGFDRGTAYTQHKGYRARFPEAD